MKTFSLLVTTSEDEKNEISQLRTEAYKVAFGTTLKSFSFLKWDENDDRGLVLCLRDSSGQAIASLRVTILYSKEELETLFDIALSLPFDCPVLALDRLVISSNYRGKGLSGLFRHYLYGNCIGSPIRNLAFTINDGSSRIPFQKKMGFKFNPADLSHRSDSPYDNNSDILLAHLPNSSFSQAYRVGSDNLIVDLSSVQIEDGFLPTLRKYLSLTDHSPNTGQIPQNNQ